VVNGASTADIPGMDSHIVTLARKQIQVISIKALGLRSSGALDMRIKKEAIFRQEFVERSPFDNK
jgi:hypothetical protein